MSEYKIVSPPHFGITFAIVVFRLENMLEKMLSLT